ncbi:hypothetical protein NDU88_011948 [Pleurodeles waltl]|uniref:Uncharacterized protein n=1 Tax=Pleurodeles waltl TaxID=8319 RepID=A0AAV7QYS7_PLEWA|nr:hypothetical protein NDU88_011948 [Pleurodeles waltl]
MSVGQGAIHNGSSRGRGSRGSYVAVRLFSHSRKVEAEEYASCKRANIRRDRTIRVFCVPGCAREEIIRGPGWQGFVLIHAPEVEDESAPEVKDERDPAKAWVDPISNISLCWLG